MFCLKNLKLNLTGPKSKLIGFYETLDKINWKFEFYVVNLYATKLLCIPKSKTGCVVSQVFVSSYGYTWSLVPVRSSWIYIR